MDRLTPPPLRYTLVFNLPSDNEHNSQNSQCSACIHILLYCVVVVVDDDAALCVLMVDCVHRFGFFRLMAGSTTVRSVLLTLYAFLQFSTLNRVAMRALFSGVQWFLFCFFGRCCSWRWLWQETRWRAVKIDSHLSTCRGLQGTRYLGWELPCCRGQDRVAWGIVGHITVYPRSVYRPLIEVIFGVFLWLPWADGVGTRECRVQ